MGYARWWFRGRRDASKGVVREALEETGVACEAVALVGVYDSRFCGTRSLHQLYQFSFLCRPLPDVPPIASPTHAHEVLEKGWFPEDALPTDIDPGHVQRIPPRRFVYGTESKRHFLIRYEIHGEDKTSSLPYTFGV